MSKQLRQRTPPQRVVTSYDAQQQQEHQEPFTSTMSMNSPLSYQQQFSSTSSSTRKKINRSTSISNSATGTTQQINNHFNDNNGVPYHCNTTTSSYLPTPTFVRANVTPGSISIDDGKSTTNYSSSISTDDENSHSWWKQRLVLIIGLMCLVAPWMRHSRTLWEVKKLKDEFIELQNDQMRLQSRVRTQKDAYNKITTDITKHQSRNSELLQQLRDHGDHYHDFDAEHYQEQSNVEDSYLKRIDILEKEIQRMADRQLVSRGYGTAFRRSDAIHVEIILKQGVSIHGNKLVMELGPMTFLSHAIELFLMLVEHKQYYNNLMLMHRSMGSSIISTVPMDSDTLQLVSSNILQRGHPIIGSSDDTKSKIETNRENTFMMDQLAMLEHTEDFPVQKYSVLFADKGPHFYIQMDEQQAKNRDKQETCFGRIVEGHAILEYMSHHHDRNFRGMYMVGIETIKVIKPIESDEYNPTVVGIDPRFPISEVAI